MRILGLCLLLVGALALGGCDVLGMAQQDDIIEVAEDDAAMNAAIEGARRSLPSFWRRLAAPAANEADFQLKLGISDGTNTEHFWCGEIIGDARRASCVIANDPQLVYTVRYGERVDVDPAIISDWLYYADDKIHGATTLRVLLPMMPEAEAAEFSAMLANP